MGRAVRRLAGPRQCSRPKAASSSTARRGSWWCAMPKPARSSSHRHRHLGCRADDLSRQCSMSRSAGWEGAAGASCRPMPPPMRGQRQPDTGVRIGGGRAGRPTAPVAPAPAAHAAFRCDPGNDRAGSRCYRGCSLCHSNQPRAPLPDLRGCSRDARVFERRAERPLVPNGMPRWDACSNQQEGDPRPDRPAEAGPRATWREGQAARRQPSRFCPISSR